MCDVKNVSMERRNDVEDGSFGAFEGVMIGHQGTVILETRLTWRSGAPCKRKIRCGFGLSSN